MKITLLADNRESGAFLPEFGLALLLEQAGKRLLFDTGAGTALLPNLKLLGLKPENLPEVILSHGHYDHTGGIADLVPRRVWCAPGIFEKHYSRHADGSIHDISMPESSAAVLRKSGIMTVNHFSEIMPGIWLTGPVPRISGEDCGGDFYREKECLCKDTIPEEQALLTRNGILISGCCHAGIINTLLFCREKHPEIVIHTIVGGLHLRHASEERIRKTAAFLQENKIRQLVLFHCTGEAAVDKLKELLPDCSVVSPLPGETWEC